MSSTLTHAQSEMGTPHHRERLNDRTITVSLHLAARDVPEPDSRSHANYAVVYYARDVPHRSSRTVHPSQFHHHASAVSTDTVTSIPASEPPSPISPRGLDHFGLDEAQGPANHSTVSLATTRAETNKVAQSPDVDIIERVSPTVRASGRAAPQQTQRGLTTTSSQKRREEEEERKHRQFSPSFNNNNSKNNTYKKNLARDKSFSSKKKIFPLSTHKSRKNVVADRVSEGLGSPPRRRASTGVSATDGGRGNPAMRKVASTANGQRDTLGVSRPPHHPLSRGSTAIGMQRKQSTPIPSDQAFSNFSAMAVGNVDREESNTTASHQPSQPSAPPLPNLLTPLIRIIPQSPSIQRSPERVLKRIAPSCETTLTTPSGTSYTRSGWTEMGATEVARKHGRDVEFARAFTVSFPTRKGERIKVRVAIFDATSSNYKRQRLIAMSDFSLSSVVAANGSRLVVPLRFHPISNKDHRRKKRIPQGSLVVVAQRVNPDAAKAFRLDVECNRIIRATALSTTSVRAAFYTLHAIIDSDPNSDAWTLIHRSTTVEMIHSKRDGGSLEYNYFSGVRLRTKRKTPVVNKNSNDEDDNNESRQHASDDDNDNNDNGMASGGGGDGGGQGSDMEEADEGGILDLLSKALGVRKKIKFFSMPGTDLKLMDASIRLKLSLWEDKGMTAGYDLIADTQFSIADVKKWSVGQSSALKVHANVVGKAVLKFVECSPDPRYFCFSLMMQNII